MQLRPAVDKTTGPYDYEKEQRENAKYSGKIDSSLKSWKYRVRLSSSIPNQAIQNGSSISTEVVLRQVLPVSAERLPSIF